MAVKGKNQYRSMRGKVIDMDLLHKKNELTPAVGNAKVNARGDELGAGGRIVRKREEIIKKHYNKKPAMSDESGVRKSENTLETTPVPTTVSAELPVEELSQEEIDMFVDSMEDDQWIEDDQGNFVKKDSE